MYHNLNAEASFGDANGPVVLLDAEQFNYADFKSTGAGFKLALHDHRDKPLLKFSSQFVHTGAEIQINLTPTIIYTTNDAIAKLTPDQRGCYVEGENNMTYLKYSGGYRNGLKNCLIDQGIRDILWNCRCRPIFASAGFSGSLKVPACTGKELHCANQRIQNMGVENPTIDIVVPEALKNPNKIGNMTKPPSIKCMPECHIQENPNQISFAPFPQYDNFFYQQVFCHVSSHIWQVSCQNENRRFFIDTKYPKLCLALKDFDEYFGNNATCLAWPGNFFEKNKEPNKTLSDELYWYGRDNLALIHLLIQSPYVTKLKKDVAMTFTNYVANTGGLLGLCLGFSFISAIEIFYWCCCCCQKFKSHILFQN